MIEPAYRRDQLWERPRRAIPATMLGGAIAGGALTILIAMTTYAPTRTFVSIGDSPAERAHLLVTRLAVEDLPAWREHHPGCPRRLSQLLTNAGLDPWGHALHYSCDPRLVPGHHFAVVSAGEDGVFGTADDIAAHD